jgi:membrane-associated protein
VFDKPKSKLFKPQHVRKTQDFFDKYGNRAIVLGRFVPVVRTFITVMAGVGQMEAKRYLTYSLIGGIAWAAGVTVLGFWLGQFAFVRDHIELMLIVIVLVSVLPIIFEVLRARRSGGAHAR